MSPEKQNESFICKIPDVCEFLSEEKFQAKAKGNTCNLMNYWVKKAIKYHTEEDTFLSQDAVKVFEKIEPKKEKGETIYEIFKRMWTDPMSQGMKYLNEETWKKSLFVTYSIHPCLPCPIANILIKLIILEDTSSRNECSLQIVKMNVQAN
jgi:hypothetical protein